MKHRLLFLMLFFFLNVFLAQGCNQESQASKSSTPVDPNLPKDDENNGQDTQCVEAPKLPFVASVTKHSGPITARTFSVVMVAKTEDVGQEGAIFVAAILKDGRMFYLSEPGKWIFRAADATTPPPALNVGKIPASFESAVEVAGSDLTGYLGAKVFIGYGLGKDPEPEMMSAKRYIRFYDLVD